MALAYGIDLYLNGDLVDCDDYGNVNIGVGDFGPINAGTPHRATFDIYADWGSLLSERTIVTIIMTGPDPGTTAPTGVYDSGSAWEYCLFSGTLASRQGNGPNIHKPTVISTTWVGDDANIFNQKLSMAADTAVGHRGLVDNVATDLSIANTGVNGFTDNTFLESHQFAQTGSVGAFLQKAGAGAGTWVTCEWDWDGAAADFVWRPTYFNETSGDVDMARQLLSTQRHMWLLDWRDVGVVFDDYYYRVRVEGRNSASVDKSGSDVGTQPAETGNRTVIVDTFIDNDPDCATAATHLIFRIGAAAQQKVYNVTGHLDLLRNKLVGEDDSADVYNATEALLPTWEWAYLRPGDLIQWVAPTGGAIDWPATADALEAQFMAVINGDIDEASNFSLVTGATWSWTPQLGWSCAKSLMRYP
jgi:hypothetical protein